MGLLVDGEWQDQWYDTKNTAANLYANQPNSATGWESSQRQTATSIPQRKTATIYMYR